MILAIMAPAVVLADMRLIMITSDYCPFCRAWERDVGVIYYGSMENTIQEIDDILEDIEDVREEIFGAL